MTLVAITGSTGHLGRLAISALTKRAPKIDIIGLARNINAQTTVPSRSFDYTKTETLAAALVGVNVLVLISSNDFNDRAGQHRNVIAAAKTAGVGRIVYTSILHGAANPMLLAQDHIATEKLIRASGLPATILRNGWYSENYTNSLGGVMAAGAVIGCAGAGRISSAARQDYAEAIAAVAADSSHVNLTYDLAGDQAHTMAEFAAELSRQSGKTIPYTDLPTEDYKTILQGFGLPAGFAAVMADSDLCAAAGALFDESRTLSKLIGRPTTPIAATIKTALQQLSRG